MGGRRGRARRGAVGSIGGGVPAAAAAFAGSVAMAYASANPGLTRQSASRAAMTPAASFFAFSSATPAATSATV